MSSEDDYPESPLQHYLQEILPGRNLTPNRNWTYEEIVRKFEDQILIPEGISAEEIDTPEARRFANNLEDQHESNTAGSYLSTLNKIYEWMRDKGIINRNPFRIVTRDRDFTKGYRRRRDISVSEMGSFLKRGFSNPLLLAVFTMLAKTGMRVGEIVNLDLRDVYLDHPKVQQCYPARRTELDGRPDTIYVTNEIDMGTEYRNEIRKAGNKRKRVTFFPIDPELKQILVYYLNTRPTVDVVERPFFVGQGGITKRLNQRLTPATVQGQLRERASAEGWRDGKYNPQNVTPHYFRHFFTTHAKRRMDELTVKYLRGDKGDDVMDRYTHNWGNEVRREYLANIYELY
ncbi:site-specific integrase [Halorubellus litoreus]|uniref:Tyrosine-type recombinase/integrase n=1 Tax=Halorubellus litoreus TaxID=755308 RepID=A0ABD5VD67_9EURY